MVFDREQILALHPFQTFMDDAEQGDYGLYHLSQLRSMILGLKPVNSLGQVNDALSQCHVIELVQMRDKNHQFRDETD